MKLSFNIPTYNRAKYLAVSLEKISCQIEDLKLHNQVEINLSDNASTDNTREVWDNCVKLHPSIKYTYKCNEKNLGPDRNFLSAMHMANGEYSLLWGDDDFLKEGGLKRIMDLIDFGETNSVEIMVSSTSVIDANGRFLHDKYFLRDDIDELLVDFSDINQVRGYFFLLKDMGGLLSFISDVIYKTRIIYDIKYNDAFTGTHYAFLNYWWGWLADGHKLYYSRVSFIDETVQYQAAYGYGVKRSLVDFDGYLLIAKLLLTNVQWALDFKNAVLKTHSVFVYRFIYLGEKRKFKKMLESRLRECGCSNLTEFYQSCSFNSIIKSLVYCILPDSIMERIKGLFK